MAVDTTKKFGEVNYMSNGMGIPAHDYISYAYNADGNVTLTTYKLGGASGATVASVAYTYSGNQVTAVDRTV
jgi:hypothetical protein